MLGGSFDKTKVYTQNWTRHLYATASLVQGMNRYILIKPVSR